VHKLALSSLRSVAGYAFELHDLGASRASFSNAACEDALPHRVFEIESQPLKIATAQWIVESLKQSRLRFHAAHVNSGIHVFFAVVRRS
jgi:hypothetical protein